jgi:hypothetical protein
LNHSPAWKQYAKRQKTNPLTHFLSKIRGAIGCLTFYGLATPDKLWDDSFPVNTQFNYLLDESAGSFSRHKAGKSIYNIGKEFLEDDFAKSTAEFKSFPLQENQAEMKLPLKTSARQRMSLGFMC